MLFLWSRGKMGLDFGGNTQSMRGIFYLFFVVLAEDKAKSIA
jgi:hypothetical protein